MELIPVEHWTHDGREWLALLDRFLDEVGLSLDTMAGDQAELFRDVILDAASQRASFTWCPCPDCQPPGMDTPVDTSGPVSGPCGPQVDQEVDQVDHPVSIVSTPVSTPVDTDVSMPRSGGWTTLDRARATLAQNPGLTYRELATALDVSPRTASRLLTKLSTMSTPVATVMNVSKPMATVGQ